ncbi:MAG: helix-turn-helix domain-containing protein [Planktomarina sp.]
MEIAPEKRVIITPLPNLVRDGAWKTELLHSKPHHRLIWITRGQGQMTFSASRRAYGPYQLVCIPAHSPYSFEVRPSNFGFVVDIPFIDQFKIPPHPFSLKLSKVAEQRKCASLIDTLQSEINLARDYGFDDLSTLALDYQIGLFSVWLERTAREQTVWDNLYTPAQSLVQRYCRLLQTEMGKGQNVAGFAKMLRVTPTYLTRCCKTTLNRSAHDILNECLQHRARLLLGATKTPIKQIASDLGFTSAAYFTRSFQSMTGQTPSDYRTALEIA